MKRGYVDTPDGQIHYRTEGSGETLLLVHCATESSEEFVDMMPILGKSYRAVAMDLPGFGMSDKLPHRYSMDDYARSVIDFMDALDISRTSIVGRGTGGSAAGEVAILHPERVDKLIFSACPYYTPELRKSRQKDERFFPKEIKEDGSHLMKQWEVLRHDWPHSTVESIQRNTVNYFLAGVDAEDMHQAIFRYEMEKRLPLIKSPVLLITGPDDVFYKFLEETKSLIPRCKVKVIEGGGGGIGGLHLCYERPTEFAQLILDFLKERELKEEAAAD